MKNSVMLKSPQILKYMVVENTVPAFLDNFEYELNKYINPKTNNAFVNLSDLFYFFRICK